MSGQPSEQSRNDVPAAGAFACAGGDALIQPHTVHETARRTAIRLIMTRSAAHLEIFCGANTRLNWALAADTVPGSGALAARMVSLHNPVLLKSINYALTGLDIWEFVSTRALWTLATISL
jgi:hypothetical protein